MITKKAAAQFDSMFAKTTVKKSGKKEHPTSDEIVGLILEARQQIVKDVDDTLIEFVTNFHRLDSPDSSDLSSRDYFNDLVEIMWSAVQARMTPDEHQVADDVQVIS